MNKGIHLRIVAPRTFYINMQIVILITKIRHDIAYICLLKFVEHCMAYVILRENANPTFSHALLHLLKKVLVNALIVLINLQFN